MVVTLAFTQILLLSDNHLFNQTFPLQEFAQFLLFVGHFIMILLLLIIVFVIL